MGDLANLGGYILVMLAAGRIAFILARRDGASSDDATYTGVLVAVLWPIVLGVCLALLPFIAIGWLISRPPRRERTEAALLLPNALESEITDA